MNNFGTPASTRDYLDDAVSSRGKADSQRTVAVMQPYFFPYGGYYALIAAVDLFILDDLTRYTPKRWMNRNRIRRVSRGGSADGWQYLTLPVRRCPSGTPIHRVPLAVQPWRQVMEGRLTACAGALHYHAVMQLFDCWATAVQQLPAPTLADANTLGLQLVCNVLGLDTPLIRLSALLPQLSGYCPPYPKGENALAVCRSLGNVCEYRNLPGGAAFYPRQPYHQAGIRLVFQQWEGAVGGVPLSILDLMMDNTPQQIRRQLLQVRLFE